MGCLAGHELIADSYNPPWGWVNRASRGDQMACIIEHLRCSSRPFVLQADLNVGPSAPEMQTLFASGLVSARGNLSEPTHELTKLRVDYIFVSQQLQCGLSSIIHEGPSDHSVLVAEVRSRQSSRERPEKHR